MEKKLNIAMVAACPFPVAQGSQVLIKQVSGALVKNDDSEGFAEGSIHLIKDPVLAKRSGKCKNNFILVGIG